MRIAKITPSGAVHYFLADHLGSTRKVLDASRNTVFSTDYEPFGKPYAVTGTESYTYTSEKHDDPTGLVYLRARQYDPDIGRFVSADPVLGTLAAPQTLNRYAYVSNNPLTSTDPSGMSQCNPQAGDQLYAACERWSDWDAFTRWFSEHPYPCDIGCRDEAMAVIGILPGFDILSDLYFAWRDVSDCLAGKCDWGALLIDVGSFVVPIGIAGISKLPKILGRADNLARAWNRLPGGVLYDPVREAHVLERHVDITRWLDRSKFAPGTKWGREFIGEVLTHPARTPLTHRGRLVVVVEDMGRVTATNGGRAGTVVVDFRRIPGEAVAWTWYPGVPHWYRGI